MAASPSPSPSSSHQPPSPAAIPTPAPTASPISKSPLSPTARPFYPAASGRAKETRWMECSDDEEELVDYGFTPSPSPPPASFRDVVCGRHHTSPSASPSPSSPTVPAAVAPATAVATVVAASRGEDAVPARRRRRRPSRRAPPLRVAAPPPPRVPLQERLGPRLPRDDDRRRPRVDEDGFEEVVSRSTRRRFRRAETSSDRSSTPSTSRPIPPEMRDRCLNCLSYSHRVATCRLPPRCRLCHKLRHLAWQCPLSRSRSPPAEEAEGGFGRSPSQRFRVLSSGSPTPSASQVPSRTPSPSPPTSPPESRQATRPSVATRSTGQRNAVCASPECCYVERSEAMAAEETRLHFALLAVVGNASRNVEPSEASSAIAAATGLPEADFVVKPFHPDNFLVICSSQRCRD
ncbi:unnamed protein product [Urochloa humidicola]